MQNIIRLASQFRRAMDEAHYNGDFIYDCTFKNFPVGCCDHSSDLLAHYLLTNDIKTVNVFGEYHTGAYDSDGFEITYPHAWLQTANGIIIDITGDQFRLKSDLLYFDEPCYIGAETEFHQLFNGQPRKNTDFFYSRNPMLNWMRDLYSLIEKYIK